MSIKSDAQRRAVAKYNATNYERIELRVDMGKKNEIRAHSEKHGESLNGFINRAIDETIARDTEHGQTNVRNHEIIVRGKCTACGKPLGENDGLFLCSECQEKNRKEIR